jgi:hypothetical protein
MVPVHGVRVVDAVGVPPVAGAGPLEDATDGDGLAVDGFGLAEASASDDRVADGRESAVAFPDALRLKVVTEAIAIPTRTPTNKTATL